MFLEGYGGQTTEQLLAMASQYRIDSLVLAFEEGLSRKGSLTPEERVVLAVEAMEREVNNGGFHQFFTNSSGEYAEELPGALDRIGCPATAALAREALAARTDPDRLDAIDGRYYESREDIAGRLFEFIRQNAGSITLP